MSSPYVRRLRLGAEIRQLRRAAGFSSAEALAKRVGTTRREVQQLEGAERDRTIDFDLVARILPAIGIESGGHRWRGMMKIARDASDAGWWKSAAYRGMGDRQAVYAELEAGATSIRLYEPTIVPGLAQTEAYCRSLAKALATDDEPVNTEAVVAGRLRRQEQVESAGTKLEIILEEVAIRRLVAPPAVMAEQLTRLGELASSNQIRIHVLPSEAKFIEVRSPREAFTLFTYPDPGDPTVALVETVTDDDILTASKKVAPYERLYERCRKLALSPQKSLDFIGNVADALSAKH